MATLAGDPTTKSNWWEHQANMMDSINPAITQLHAAYNKAMGFTDMGLDLMMMPTYERMYFESLKQGLTPEHLELCVLERMRLNLSSQFKMKLTLYDLIGDEAATARTMNEAAIVLASRRKKVMEPARASVLRQTGRSTDMPQDEARLVADSKLIQDLRKAAQ